MIWEASRRCGNRCKPGVEFRKAEPEGDRRRESKVKRKARPKGRQTAQAGGGPDGSRQDATSTYCEIFNMKRQRPQGLWRFRLRRGRIIAKLRSVAIATIVLLLNGGTELLAARPEHGESDDWV